MLRIGLTGGIGSGKSAVAEEFRRLGVPIVDTDEIARELVEPASDALKEIVSAFGPDVVGDDGRLNRAKLRARVFANAEQRKRLESILHPRIRDEVTKRVARCSAPYCLLVIPLLLETGFRDLADKLLVVDASDDTRIARLIRSRGLSNMDITNIMATQATREQRIAAADDVINNDGSLDELRLPVGELHRKYIRLAATGTK